MSMQPANHQSIQIVNLNTDYSESSSLQSNPLLDVNNNATCPAKQLIKPSSDIVFSNQTSKLLKQVPNCNLSAPVMGKYNLRKKSVQTRSDSIKKQQEAKLHLRGLDDSKDSKDSKPKKRNSQLSRYKRKNANARERSRVQAINAAFERLKRILPEFIQEQTVPAAASSSSHSKAELTKIATLRTATDYIKLLCKLRDEEASQVNGEQISGDHLPATSELNSDKQPKADDLRMDTLPDISFISSDELSSLSFTSDEENQLPKCDNKTFDLVPACSNTGCAQSETFSVKSSDSSLFVDKTVSYVNSSVLGNQVSDQANTYPLTNSYQTSGQHFNQASVTTVNNQTYSVPSHTLSNLNTIHNQSTSQFATASERFYTYTLQSTNSESNLKSSSNLLDANNNQYFNQASRSRNMIASTPLLDKSNDHHSPINHHHHQHINHQLQSTLFSPIKGEDHQPANHLSFKSTVLTEDSLLNCLEDIENSDNFFCHTTTLTSNDDFDLIL